jgi:threonine dehydratase
LSADDVIRALPLIQSNIVRTPVLQNPELDDRFSCTLFCKCENLQRTGAFKIRGASHAISRLGLSGHRGGVVAESSGNHGAALSLAARLDNRSAHIIMPTTSVEEKRRLVRHYGGTVHLYDPSVESGAARVAELVEKGLRLVHPFEDEDVILGQGTVTLELLSAVSDLDTVVAPIGGGGLISGASLLTSRSSIELIGVEPQGAADVHDSLRKGRRISEHTADTVADGLRSLVGEQTFSIIRRHVDRVLLVSEREIERAVAEAWLLARMVIEPSSATVFAALSRYPDVFAGKRVGAIVTGGNIAVESWSQMVRAASDSPVVPPRSAMKQL